MAKAIWENTVIAESEDIVKVEGNLYFPPDSLKMEFFKTTESHTTCGFKGVASYFTVQVNGKENVDAAWYYPDSSCKMESIDNRVAFWKGVEVIP